MTKTLILMRHAKSDWTTPGQEDKERPLNPRGRNAAPRMAEWLWSRGECPQHVLCSTSVRTRETWDLMQAKFRDLAETGRASTGDDPNEAVRVDFMDSLYLAPPETLWSAFVETIRLYPRIERVLLLAHNPGMEMLASQLRREWQEMPTAAISVFRWGESIQEGEGAIELDNAKWQATQKPKEL